MDTKEIFSNWTPRKYFQIAHEGNILKIDIKEMFPNWTLRKYFQSGHQGNICKLDT